MGFAVTLLVLLASACALSSLVEQGLTRETYAVRYGEGWAGLIMALQVNDAYHSVWFVALSGFLCLNLILCSVLHLPSVLHRYRQERDPAIAVTEGELGSWETECPERVFEILGMGTPEKYSGADGREVLFASRNRMGIWGPWICHVGVLLLIAGFALGQVTLQETVIWGTAGDVRSMPETGLEIAIDEFRTETREDASVAQYVTEITVTDPKTGKSEKKTVSVNHPADAGGFRLYQNNTGPAAVAIVVHEGETVQRRTLLPQQTMAESVLGLQTQPEYAFYFAGIRTMKQEEKGEQTLYLYDLYKNGVLDQSYYFLGEGKVTVGTDEVTFTPSPFTLLVARKDRFAPLALLGGVVLLAGLALAFMLQPKSFWAVKEDGVKWSLHGRCRKGQALMKEQLEEAVRAAEQEAKHAER